MRAQARPRGRVLVAVLTEGMIVGTATRKLGEGAQSGNWHVRNERGETFGPVDIDALKSWACDGRLAPTNDVSGDGAEWQLATSVRALEMDWVAEVTPGTFYGPIHRRAMEELVKDGSIAEQSAFFARRKLDEPSGQQSDAAQAENVRCLTDQVAQALRRAAASEERTEQALQRAATSEGRAEQARQLAKSSEERAEQARQLAKASEEQAEQARQLAKSSEEQAEQARQRAVTSGEQLERVRQQASSSEEQAQQARSQVAAYATHVEQMRQQLTAQAEQAQRQVAAYEEQLRLVQQQVAAYEEQVRLAQQQAAAFAAQAEQARQQASADGARLRVAEQQMSEQAERAVVAQRQVLAQAEELSGEVARLRKEHAESVEQAAGLRAERDVRVAALAEQARAFEAERQKLREALNHAQAGAAVREARLAQIEKALVSTEGAGVERGALESQVLVLGAERVGLQQALECEKGAAQQAEARCATLEAALASEKNVAQQAEARCATLEIALGEERARRNRETSLEDVSSELRQVRRQVEDLCAQVRQTNEARESAQAERAAKRVVAEPVEAEVLPPERPASAAKAHETERVMPEWHKKPADAPPAPNHGRVSPGMSMSDLEQQARRELERLGAQGANLFKRKK